MKLILPTALQNAIREFHPEIKKKIRQGLEVILENPQAGKALKEDLAGLYSYRLGRFRIIYAFQSDAVLVKAIGPRKTIYEETMFLLKRG